MIDIECNNDFLKKYFMPDKDKPVKPSEVPSPSNPEIAPHIPPEEPLLPEKPEIIPEKEPAKFPRPDEIPEPEG